MEVINEIVRILLNFIKSARIQKHKWLKNFRIFRKKYVCINSTLLGYFHIPAKNSHIFSFNFK